MSTSTTAITAPVDVDARVPRVIATVTAAVLAAALAAAAVTPRAAAAVLAAQALIFAIGAVGGPLRHPYGVVITNLFSPRPGPVTKRDPVALWRFAQTLGLVLCVIGAAGFALGAPVVGWMSAGFALVAAVARAAFGICLSRGPYILSCHLRGQTPACCRKK